MQESFSNFKSLSNSEKGQEPNPLTIPLIILMGDNYDLLVNTSQSIWDKHICEDLFFI